MSRISLILLSAGMTAGCNAQEVTGGPPLPDYAIVDGATVRAVANRARDSVLVRITFTADDTPSTVKLMRCVVTVEAYVDTPRVASSPVWSENQQPMRACPDNQIWVVLQPRESKELRHTVVRRRAAQGAPLPRRPLHFAVTLERAEGADVTIRAR